MMAKAGSAGLGEKKGKGPSVQDVEKVLFLFNHQRYDEVVVAARRLTEKFPLHGLGWALLGAAYVRLGEVQRAVSTMTKGVAFLPGDFEMHYNLGLALRDAGRLEDAEKSFRKVIRIQPNFTGAHSSLGRVLHEQNRLDEAEACFLEAVRIDPGFVDAYYNLGITLKHKGSIQEAEKSFLRALDVDPNYVDAICSLGSLMASKGDVQGAVALFRRARQARPDLAWVHSSLIFCMDFSEVEDARSQALERQNWDLAHASRYFQSADQGYCNVLDPARRLRVGYVSSDFCDHSAARVFEAMLLHYDRTNFEVYAYSAGGIEDADTLRFRESVDAWRDIRTKADEAVAKMIRDDRIDILVDLSGHSAGDRLCVFARKPAPIQITAWGYATSTGLRAMDVFFADEVVVPRNELDLYIEKVRYLPCLAGYSAPGVLPPIKDLPCLQNGFITFGSFNRLCKLSNATLALWAKVLHAFPNSRLVLKSGELDRIYERELILGRFERCGIGQERLILIGRTDRISHMEALGEVDISLDPFPHGGGVTTLESLLMGVPVVTLRWKTIVGRLSASFLTTLELTDWIAEDEDEYLSILQEKARDVQSLANFRKELRVRFLNSVLGNPLAYVKYVEAEYRNLWADWVEKRCAKRPK